MSSMKTIMKTMVFVISMFILIFQFNVARYQESLISIFNSYEKPLVVKMIEPVYVAITLPEVCEKIRITPKDNQLFIKNVETFSKVNIKHSIISKFSKNTYEILRCIVIGNIKSDYDDKQIEKLFTSFYIITAIKLVIVTFALIIVLVNIIKLVGQV